MRREKKENNAFFLQLQIAN